MDIILRNPSEQAVERKFLPADRLDDDQVIFADDFDRRVDFDAALLGYIFREAHSKTVALFLRFCKHS